jgi:hypothetical protein
MWVQIEYCDSVVKHIESANTMFSFIWWIVGFYWVTAGGQTLTIDSPLLYWCVWLNQIFFDSFTIFLLISIFIAYGWVYFAGFVLHFLLSMLSLL